MNGEKGLSIDKIYTWLFTFFLGLSALEALLVFIWLARIPTDPKNALIGSYSGLRVSLLGSVFLTGLIFAFLAILTWHIPGLKHWHNKIHQHSSISLVFFVGLLMIMFMSLFLLLLPPPTLIPPGSGIATRLAPLLILITLLCSQALLLVIAYSPKTVRGWYYSLGETVKRIVSYPLVGYILLGISVLIAFTQVFYVYYNLGDEGNTLTTGWLLSRGLPLYKEVFSHHLPFSYLWVVMVVKIFGSSIFALRLSIIILRTLVFAIAMKLSRFTFALGLTALAWSILGHLYLANGLYYHTFSGIFLVAAFAIGLAIVTEKMSGGILELGTIGLFLGLAVLSDPIKLLPAGVIIIAIFGLGLSKPPAAARFRHRIMQAGVIVLIMIAIGGLFVLWLILTGSLVDFYNDVITYNLEIYSNYSASIGFRDIVSPVTSLLSLFNTQWRTHTDPYYTWGSFRVLDTWIFTGFFYRLVIVLASMTLLLRGKFLSFAFVYIFGALMLIRATTFFHSSPFVLYSLCICALLVSQGLGYDIFKFNNKESQKHRNLWENMNTTVFVSAWLVVFSMFTWLNIRGIGCLMVNRSKLSYSAKFAGLEGDAAYIRKMTCHQSEARLLVYPYEPIQYFASQVLPGSKYHFLPPWVAEIGQYQVIDDLQEAETLVLIDKDGIVWGYENQNYLADLIQYLDESYVFIEKPDRYSVYRSPKLEALCQNDLDIYKE
jgi:hypothetical protein